MPISMDEDLKYNLGWSVILLMLFSLLINVIIVVKEIIGRVVSGVYSAVIACKKKRAIKKQQANENEIENLETA